MAVRPVAQAARRRCRLSSELCERWQLLSTWTRQAKAVRRRGLGKLRRPFRRPLTRETVLGPIASQREKITELVDDFGSAGYAEPSSQQEGVRQFLGIDVNTEGTRAPSIAEGRGEFA